MDALTRARDFTAELNAPHRPLCVVAFHADCGGDNPHPHASMQMQAYAQMIDMLFQSARKFHPESKCVVLTSKKTDLQLVESEFSRVDCDVDEHDLMLSRTKAQLDFVDSYDFSCPVLLIDTDILINGSLDHIFCDDFDVGLTWHNEPEQPYNGGLIVLNNARPHAVRHYMHRLLDIYKVSHGGDARWYGDQFALRDAAPFSLTEIRMNRLADYQGTRFLFLPATTHNFAPKDARSLLAPRWGKFVLHFRGPRKALMWLYWDAYLKPKGAAGLGVVGASWAPYWRMVRQAWVDFVTRRKRRAERRRAAREDGARSLVSD